MSDEEQFVRERLKAAGPRPEIPSDDFQSIKSNARAVWQRRHCTPPERTPWRLWLIPAAAAIVVALFLVWWRAPSQPVAKPPVIAAYVVRIRGPVTLTQNTALTAGAVVETSADSESRIALRLAGGQSLRLNSGTRIRLADASLVELERGVIYFDSMGADENVKIRTRSGDFEPAGTQFEVVAGADSVELRVREGAVRFGTEVARAGEKLTVQANGVIARSVEQPYGTRWDWILETAPMPEIEGRTLRSFLDWVSREEGWKLKFEDERAASLSDTIILHGSIASLTPQQALETMSMSSGFRYRTADGAVIVGFTESAR
jgi:ferric-dicitrate binding protein FerR (iron transport regulator)